jgi:sucrose-6-phosphate hydrolase SacC (GH32 family)
MNRDNTQRNALTPPTTFRHAMEELLNNKKGRTVMIHSHVKKSSPVIATLAGLLLSAVFTVVQAATNSPENPFSDARIVWHMKPVEGKDTNVLSLKQNGSVRMEKLDGVEYTESLRRGGDGYVAILNNDACLLLEADKARFLRPWRNEVTLGARVWFSKRKAKPGGPFDQGSVVFFSDFIGLAIDPSGMAIAFLGEKIPSGVTFRELPLTQVEEGIWLDLVLRVGKGKLDFFCNGSLQISVPVEGDLRSPGSWPLYIGAKSWGRRTSTTSHGRKTSCFFDGKIDHVALWGYSLTDNQVALLSGLTNLNMPREKDGASLALGAYNRFFYASVHKDVNACAQEEKIIRSFVNQDSVRPGYHLTAPIGWIFDPSGACYYNGQYHVFSYRNIFRLLHNNSLDHYVSKDLVHWQQWPVAPWADCDMDVCGIWLSNHFIDDEGIPNIIYCAHGDTSEVNWEYGIRARSYDGLVSYQDKQAVIYPHHDGHTWKEGNTWYSITCRGQQVVLFTSTDLDHWTERGIVYTHHKGFEFPYLIKFGDKDVLMISGSCYWIGHFDRETFRFIPDHPTGLLFDYANENHCFNPLTVDQKGPGGSERRIIMAMVGSGVALSASGEFHGIPWRGMHVMPRSLALDGNRLRQDPLPEFEVLRGAHISQKNIRVKPDGLGYIQKQGDMLEIIAEFEPGDARVFGLKVRLSADGKTFVRIFYDTATSEYGVDGNVAGRKDMVKGPTYIPKGDPVKIHVFLDKCLVETFVNGQTCTALLKDQNLKNLGLDLFTEGGTATCKSLDIWEMKSAIPH